MELKPLAAHVLDQNPKLQLSPPVHLKRLSRPLTLLHLPQKRKREGGKRESEISVLVTIEPERPFLLKLPGGPSTISSTQFVLAAIAPGIHLDADVGFRLLLKALPDHRGAEL